MLVTVVVVIVGTVSLITLTDFGLRLTLLGVMLLMLVGFSVIHGEENLRWMLLLVVLFAMVGLLLVFVIKPREPDPTKPPPATHEATKWL